MHGAGRSSMRSGKIMRKQPYLEGAPLMRVTKFSRDVHLGDETLFLVKTVQFLKHGRDGRRKLNFPHDHGGGQYR